MPVSVSIVEDVDDIRESLALLINGSPGFQCVSTYANGKEAVKGLLHDHPDVILMDINLPDISGIECVHELKSRNPALQILMLTMYEDSEQVFNALAAGASGYLLKRTPPSKLLEAIQEVVQGGSPMSMQISRMVVQSFLRPGKSKNDDPTKLTPREEEILMHLSKGLRYKEIADALFINVETVRSHLRRIYEKLQVRSGMEAVLKYLKK